MRGAKVVGSSASIQGLKLIEVTADVASKERSGRQLLGPDRAPIESNFRSPEAPYRSTSARHGCKVVTDMLAGPTKRSVKLASESANRSMPLVDHAVGPPEVPVVARHVR